MVSCLECPLGKNCRIYILQLIQKQVYMTWSFWHRLKCGEVKWEVLFPQLHPVTCLIQIHEQLNYSWSAEVHRCSWELVTHNIFLLFPSVRSDKWGLLNTVWYWDSANQPYTDFFRCQFHAVQWNFPWSNLGKDSSLGDISWHSRFLISLTSHQNVWMCISKYHLSWGMSTLKTLALITVNVNARN